MSTQFRVAKPAYQAREERTVPMFESLESRQMMSATSLKVVKVRAPRPVTPPIVMAAGESPSQRAAAQYGGPKVNCTPPPYPIVHGSGCPEAKTPEQGSRP